jgi:hypothetical protein
MKFQIRKIFLVVLPSLIAFFSSADGANLSPSILTDQTLGGVVSPYTAKLVPLIQTARTAAPKNSREDIILECLKSKESPYYVGARQELVMHASIKSVAAIMDDIDHYQQLFPGYKDIHVVSRENEDILTYWEQIVPIPFVPNVTYQMIYRLAWLGETEKLYRYQLKAQTTLIVSDGFIYLRELPNHDTLYIEYDYFDAKWGAAKTFGARKIWYDSVEGMAISDLATKVKTEKPNLAPAEAQREARKILKSETISNCVSAIM